MRSAKSAMAASYDLNTFAEPTRAAFPTLHTGGAGVRAGRSMRRSTSVFSTKW